MNHTGAELPEGRVFSYTRVSSQQQALRNKRWGNGSRVETVALQAIAMAGITRPKRLTGVEVHWSDVNA